MQREGDVSLRSPAISSPATDAQAWEEQYAEAGCGKLARHLMPISLVNASASFMNDAATDLHRAPQIF